MADPTRWFRMGSCRVDLDAIAILTSAEVEPPPEPSPDGQVRRHLVMVTLAGHARPVTLCFSVDEMRQFYEAFEHRHGATLAERVGN